MKKVIVIMMALVLVFSVSAMAKAKVKINLKSEGSYLGAKGLGIGLEGGYNNGIVLKTWLSDDSAIQLDASFGLGWGGGFGIGAAYLIHNFDIIEITDSKLPLYFGLKAAVSFFGAGYYSYGGVNIGILVPLGIAWIPKEYPIDIFAQFEPGLGIYMYGSGAYSYTGVGWYPGGCAGIRYWFN